MGLRPPHYHDILSGKSRLHWFEVISENFLNTSGRPRWILEKVRDSYPVALHGVSMNLGSTAPLNKAYLKQLKKLIREIEPWVVSDHLCWGGIEGRHWHDLLPLPMNEDSVKHCARRIRQVQEILDQRLVIENISSYLRFKSDDLNEAEFISAVLEESDAGLLLDLNNVFVNSKNHGWDPYDFIDQIPGHRVVQIHLAGHYPLGDILLDSHDRPIISEVWELLRYTIEKFGSRPFMIERDDSISELQEVEREVEFARNLVDEALGVRELKRTKKVGS